MTDKAGAIKSILKPNKIKLLVFTNKNTLYKVAYTVKPALHNTLLFQYTLYPAIIKLQTILSLYTSFDLDRFNCKILSSIFLPFMLF